MLWGCDLPNVATREHQGKACCKLCNWIKSFQVQADTSSNSFLKAKFLIILPTEGGSTLAPSEYMLGALSLKQGTQSSMCNCGEQKWRKLFWTRGTRGNVTNKSMVDTEYLLCLKGHGEGTLLFQTNSCTVLEKYQQDLYDGDAFIVIFNTIYPSSTCYTEGRTHSCSLPFSSISTVARAGGNPLRLATAKSKQSLQPPVCTPCCKLAPQELSTSLEGRFGQDDLQKFLQPQALSDLHWVSQCHTSSVTRTATTVQCNIPYVSVKVTIM